MDDPPLPRTQGISVVPELTREEKSHRSALLIVFLVVFVDLLGFGIVLPLLPLYATDLLLPLLPGDDKAGLRGMILGFLMASFSAMQFIFAPIWGRISDRIGRRPILLFGLAGSVLFYTLFGIASEIGAAGREALGITLLFVARLGAGVAGATISTAQAVIADSTTPERRSRGMALIGMAFGIGFTLGPVLGFASLLIELAGAPGFAAGALSLIAFLLGWRLLPETLRAGTTGLRRNWIDLQGWKMVWQMPSVRILVISFFLATFAFGGLESTLALVNKTLLEGEVKRHLETTRADMVSSTQRYNFLIFAYVGLVLVLTQGFYRPMVQRVGEVRFLRIGFGLMTLGLMGGMGVLLIRDSVQSPEMRMVMAMFVYTIAVVGFALMTPSVQALISIRSDPTKQGEILGVNQSASALARILGPMFSLWFFFLSPSHILPYAFGAALLCLVLVLSRQIKQG